MKRLLVLLLLTVFCLSGCSGDALTGYTEALKKTGSIRGGKLQVDTAVDMEFNLDNLTVEEIKDIKYLEHMDFSCEVTYDDSEDNKKAMSRCYGNIGGLGIDAKVYVNGEQVNLYLPMLGGYLNLTDAAYQDKLKASEKIGELFEPLINKFLELLTTKDIIKGKRTYITTEDGQIKTTVYTVQVNEDQMLGLIEETTRIMESEKINIGEFLGMDIEIKDVIEAMQDWKEYFILSGFTSTAYVDFDGRLVMQDYTMEMTFKDAATTKGPVRIKISGKVTYSGLGEAQEIEVPKVTPDMYVEEGWEDLWN